MFRGIEERKTLYVKDLVESAILHKWVNEEEQIGPPYRYTAIRMNHPPFLSRASNECPQPVAAVRLVWNPYMLGV